VAGIARPATTAVVPTSPPLHFNIKLSVVLLFCASRRSASADDGLQMSLSEQQQQ